MNYLRTTALVAASCGFIIAAAHAEPGRYDATDQTLTLPFVQIFSGDNNSGSHADAKLKWHSKLQYFTLDDVNISKTEGKTIIGGDLNTINNPLIQPNKPELSGGGKNQSLNFGDVIIGTYGNDILIGGLGIDTLLGETGDDILIGGTEDFNPENRDRAFGGKGQDAFIWTPGDGNDYYNGGSGIDVIIFGKGSEKDGQGGVKFTVEKDQNFDGIFIDPNTKLPLVDVTGSPGFCTILDGSNQNPADLAKIGVDHLVRFTLRGKADTFDAGTQKEDNGLRVTLHLKAVEYIVCTSRSGGEIEVFDITKQPAVKASLSDLPERFQKLVK
jgi:Ca2+-binding RTX toxin-like protein